MNNETKMKINKDQIEEYISDKDSAMSSFDETIYCFNNKYRVGDSEKRLKTSFTIDSENEYIYVEVELVPLFNELYADYVFAVFDMASTKILPASFMYKNNAISLRIPYDISRLPINDDAIESTLKHLSRGVTNCYDAITKAASGKYISFKPAPCINEDEEEACASDDTLVPELNLSDLIKFDKDDDEKEEVDDEENEDDKDEEDAVKDFFSPPHLFDFIRKNHHPVSKENVELFKRFEDELKNKEKNKEENKNE